ncbi:acetate--CoA ligase, partial [mine drainage metagenome]
ADGATIAAHWREENYVHPPSKFLGQAYLTDAAVFERFSEENFPECFREYADLLDWKHYWHTTLDSSQPPFFKWFVGGKLNACHNCVDRHLDKHRNKTAFYFVPEQEGEPIIALTYQQLYRRVNEVAAMLRDFCGLKRGDRVTLHLPMTLELPITMLACARLGVIHSQVFSGFSASACAHRIVDSKSRVLITMDAYHRGGKLIDHGKKAEPTVAEAAREGVEIEKVLVW